MASVVTLRRTKFHIGYVAKLESLAIDDKVANLLDRRKLASWTNAEALLTGQNLAGTDREVAAGQPVSEQSDVNFVGRQQVGFQQNSYLAGIHAVQLDTRHAVDPLKPSLEQAIEQVVAVGQVPVAGYAQSQHGLVPE